MSSRTIGVVGLGGMGAGMAHALLAAGLPVAVHNRTAAKATDVVAAGAQQADSAAALAARSDVVLLSLSDEYAVEEVLFGELVPQLRPGTPVVDTSSVSPAYARHTATRLAASGVRRIEACVVGNPEMARAGQLRVFTAGDPEHVGQVQDVLTAIGQQVRHLGESGSATGLKLALNLLLGAQTVALAETVAFAEGIGVPRADLLELVAAGGWHSPVLGFRSQFMRRGEYQPAGFRAALMLKDLQLIAEEAAARGVAVPLTATAAERFADAVRAGRGDDDAAVVVEVSASAYPPPSVKEMS
ncbi:NAD(P)-dependent oxidoreductase [Micromonospora sp. LOL_015]|uniref:NAD(P)-dependent oxidoreductase n=1 Tax=Micromonospora sp. LOL_015 TaxID=3345416 RepID=UPI003A89F349